MPVKPAPLPKLGPLVTGSRFRLGQKSYALTACVCLYRYETAGGSLAEFLVLTPDMRFAHVARPTGEIATSAYASVELTPDEARDFLLAHGEGDMVDDFPDLFTLVDRAGRLTGDTTHARVAAHGTAH
jgi:hypothetical protein